MRTRKVAPVAVGLVLMLAASACSGGDDPESSSGGEEAAPAASAGGPRSLQDVCPETVVVQTDWFAESEYGTYYQMLGPDPVFDTELKRVTAPLVASGEDTGVDLEIRYGGPAIGFQQVSAQMYADDSITLGQVSTDEAIQNSAELPTVAVVAPLEISPIMIMWDTEKNPQFNTVIDIGQSDTPVLYYQTDTYMQYLLGTGQLKSSQVDGSYDGSPSRWVAADGDIAQGGFATSEPYIYKNELGTGQSYDVDLQLINDTGYPMYGQSLAIRAGDKEELAPCLEKLVPIIQQAQVDFMTDPGPTNDVIIQAVQADDQSVWSYSPGMAEYAVETMRSLGLVGNGQNSTLGDMQPERIQRMIEILGPIFAAQNKPIKQGLTPDQLYTNEFIDESIGL
jgi:hypothetical protein